MNPIKVMAVKWKKNIPLFLILLLSSVLRFYKISSLPALNADEAAIGYNTYSLIKTGKDEHGRPWPFEFQSFNDYKPGAYFYLALPFVKTLGLNTLAVRLPNILLSIFSIFLISELANLIYPGKQFSIFSIQFSIGTVAGFLLAISPWHIHFSRGGWESNAATTVLLFGILQYIKSVKLARSPKLSVFAFLLTMYLYHSMRLVAPILALALYLTTPRSERPELSKLLPSIAISIILLLPIVASFFSSRASARFLGVGITSDPGPKSRSDELRSQHRFPFSQGAKLIHNRLVEYTIRFFDNYTRHFSADFLFISGDEIQRNKIPNMGLLYYFEIPTLAIGIIFLAGAKGLGKFPILWLIIAPLASSLTFQSPHALRAENMIIPLELISAFGLVSIIGRPKARPKNLLVHILLLAVITWNFTYYLHQYYNHLAKSLPFSSQYGFQELVKYLRENGSNFDKIVITDRYDQPYILTLFFTGFNPSQFQADHVLTPRDNFGFSTVERFSKFEFKPIKWDNMAEYHNALIITSPEEAPAGISPIKTINFPNGKPAFELFRV